MNIAWALQHHIAPSRVHWGPSASPCQYAPALNSWENNAVSPKPEWSALIFRFFRSPELPFHFSLKSYSSLWTFKLHLRWSAQKVVRRAIFKRIYASS